MTAIPPLHEAMCWNRHDTYRSDCPVCALYEAIDRIIVACDNGTQPGRKVAFIREVARKARYG